MNLSAPDRVYHERQWSEPYRSTVRFAEVLRRLATVRAGDAVYDLGCGAGAATDYLAAEFPQASWTGIEVNEELVRMGRARGVSIVHRDMFDGSSLLADGWTALGLISWPPDAERFLELAGKHRPRWIALSSLFQRHGLYQCAQPGRPAEAVQHLLPAAIPRDRE